MSSPAFLRGCSERRDILCCFRHERRGLGDRCQIRGRVMARTVRGHGV